MSSDLMEAAIKYAQRGWKVFPVEENGKRPHKRLSKGGYKDATNNIQMIKVWWSICPNANIGLNLAGSGLVCIDADTYKDDCNFEYFMQTHHIPDTLTQTSASGGSHLIYKCGAEDTFPGTIGTAIDIKHKGYVLLSPSTFGGQNYVWENELEIAQAPQWLKKNKALPNQYQKTYLGGKSWGQPFDIEHALQEAVRGASWHDNVLRSVGAMVAQGFRDEEIHAKTDAVTLPEYSLNDTRLEVQRMIEGARNKGFDNAIVHKMKNNLGSLKLTSDSKGNPICNHSNITKILLGHPDWIDVFVYNEFTGTEQVIKGLPGAVSEDFIVKARGLTDTDYTQLCIWLNDQQMVHIQKHIVVDAVKHAARQRTINPVQSYLSKCARKLPQKLCEDFLSKWMEDYLGVEPSSDVEVAYVRAVSRLSLIQAVARVQSPGCKADSVVILEGEQGTGKSSAVRTLFGEETFGDQLPPMSNKDASSYLRGKWCVELAELEYKRKAEVETIKAFITRTHENYRPAYGREEVFIPRTNVFFGTTNATEYLVDETGNRRFLPIKTANINLEGLAEARDRLWGEAKSAFDNGEHYWLDEPLSKIAAEQTKARMEQDPWVEAVNTKLSCLTEVSINEAFERCFSIVDSKQISKEDSRRMVRALLMANWKRAGRFHKGFRRNQSKFINLNELEHKFEHDDF